MWELCQRHALWVAGESIPERLKYLVAQFSVEYINSRAVCDISAAKIKTRAYNWDKTRTGCIFEMTRHPNAHKNGYVTVREVQKWEIDLHASTITKLAERPWQQGDIDPTFED
ncbi:hypothetical protein [Thiocapsa rosea]|uniref:Uncharacterized protein n=1 Tax=Thiocapsa rosea TaxID=69360 RepID=A0A495V5T8_9GAMM|nr:hypothetical protein [Thiocapsa rosea]RKT44689.1 hypothetical protein BDD21_2087 [Thiocapsa rosea]